MDMNVFNCFATVINSIYMMFGNVNDKLNKQTTSNHKCTQDVQWFDTTTYIHSQKLNTKLFNFIKIETITINDIINKILFYLLSKLHPMSLAGVVYGLLFRCLQWKRFRCTLPVSLVVVSILLVSPARVVSITFTKKLRQGFTSFQVDVVFSHKLRLLLLELDVTIAYWLTLQARESILMGCSFLRTV